VFLLHRKTAVAIALLALSPAAAGAATDSPRKTESVCSVGANIAVRSFVGTFSAGGLGAAMHEWAPEPAFQFYATRSPGARQGAEARRRDSLLAYLRGRSLKHERLSVIRIRVFYDKKRKEVRFTGTLVRQADDLREPRRQPFSGVVVCNPQRPRLIAWRM
jgi:hypothetical protein